MKIKSKIKAGDGGGDKITTNHNHTIAGGLRIRSNVKAGGTTYQHNQTVSKGLRIKSNIKAGACPGCGANHNQTITKG